MARPRRKARRSPDRAQSLEPHAANGDGVLEVQPQEETDGPDIIWSPSVPVATLFLVLVRMLSAGTTCIGDCDETYNYWEPLHYLLYGFGFQTWEYAPQYALRSYAYLMPSYGVAKASQALLDMLGYDNDKPQVWVAVRLFHVLLCAMCEASLYQAVRARFGRHVGGFFILFSMMSGGMFVAAPALLPSSSAMTLVMATYVFWSQQKFMLAIPVSMVCIFGTGWPFVGVLFIPMLLHCALGRLREGRTTAEGLGAATAAAVWAALCAAGVFAAVMCVDSRHYGQPTSPTMNIIKYNVLDAGEGRGDELYGTEPALYYLKNLFLNLTVVWPLALALPVVVAVAYPFSSKAYQWVLRDRLLFASPAIIWLTIMFLKPHKEERFLYPAYPALFLSAAFSLETLLEMFRQITDSTRGLSLSFRRSAKMQAQLMAMSCVFFAAVLSMCRSSAVVHFHNAPCNLFKFMFYKEFEKYRKAKGGGVMGGGGGTALLPPVKVCVGGEWYRFPSSFYLPSKDVSLEFLRSNFHGQLPQPFAAVNGTSATPQQAFNDMNKEEEARFSRLKDCDYVIAERKLELKSRNASSPSRNSNTVNELIRPNSPWQMMESHGLVDTEFSDPALRAFFIPFLSRQYVTPVSLGLYKRTRRA